jgi:short-subunit dehydrogenase
MGVKVAVSGRRAEPLQALAAESANITAFPLDVTDATAVAQTFARIEQALGPLDLAVLAAGTYHPVNGREFAAKPYLEMMGTNYGGVIHGLAALLPAMRARRRGHVAWIASVAGYRGLPKASAYGPSKAALINLAESLKPELEADGITISVINPGFVKTPLTAQNDFPMPFLMEAPDAARMAISGLAQRKFEIAFPRPFVMLLKIARMLPYRAYFHLIRRHVLKP